jgi:hypothetical protein
MHTPSAPSPKSSGARATRQRLREPLSSTREVSYSRFIGGESRSSEQRAGLAEPLQQLLHVERGLMQGRGRGQIQG